jgi:hypothetical protein
MHEKENAYNTWISSQVSMDQNVLLKKRGTKFSSTRVYQ